MDITLTMETFTEYTSLPSTAKTPDKVLRFSVVVGCLFILTLLVVMTTIEIQSYIERKHLQNLLIEIESRRNYVEEALFKSKFSKGSTFADDLFQTSTAKSYDIDFNGT